MVRTQKSYDPCIPAVCLATFYRFPVCTPCTSRRCSEICALIPASMRIKDRNSPAIRDIIDQEHRRHGSSDSDMDPMPAANHSPQQSQSSGTPVCIPTGVGNVPRGTGRRERTPSIMESQMDQHMESEMGTAGLFDGVSRDQRFKAFPAGKGRNHKR